MQVYADPEFVRGLSRLHSEEREAVENCLYKLKNRNWDVGLRVKRLKGFPKRVWEARVNRADRLLFLIAPATHETSGATGSLYVLDYVDHDHVTRVRGRDLSASSYLSLVLEQAQQSENVEEEFDGCSSEQLEEWTHEEAQSGAATEYLRAYAQRFVATAEEIENLSDTERELWLTEEQMAVVTTAGHCVVSGTAGSGKTTMAVQRLLADAGSSQPKLYLAYNPWLVDYARELFQRLLPKEEREALEKIIHFKTVQQLIREYLEPASENFPEEGEVRFADFQLPYQAWNKQIPAATAWSEIRSIIKGACLDPKRELLDLKEYRELGRSRSAYLHQDREVIHKLAQQYQKWLKEKKRYDEIDLSRQATRQILSQRPAGYGTIVCDEVQDLTELQLEFIFLLNSKDGSLFFTGDLNQIINPSGFRWEEVNSHFYRRMQQKPERQHLSYNFRSTGSIVKLADAILRLRGRLIGGNSEQQRDHHLQEGQKPRLISSSDEEAVKSLVAGLVGQYAVLVRTEAQRNRLKTETGSPFIFTIEEAKGLEFDRTLVWDFFRDQQSLWRKALGGTLSAKDGPALRHELNLLYVAATRPRHWLYFYDPHTTIWAEAELDGAFDYAVPDALAEEGEARLTLEQWSRQGKYYLDREFFEQASFCFKQAEDPISARRVNAKILEHKKKWSEAGEEYFALQDFSAAARLLEKGGAWRRASEAHQQAGDSREALRCDAQAAEAERQWAVASRIWSSLGQVGKALEAIRKTNDPLLVKPMEAEALAIEGKHSRAAALYEQVADWDKAIQSWEKAERWQEAAELCLKLKRYPKAEHCAERLVFPTDRAKLKVRIGIAQNNIESARQVAQSELSPNEAIKVFQQAGLSTDAFCFEARLPIPENVVVNSINGLPVKIDRAFSAKNDQNLYALQPDTFCGVPILSPPIDYCAHLSAGMDGIDHDLHTKEGWAIRFFRPLRRPTRVMRNAVDRRAPERPITVDDESWSRDMTLALDMEKRFADAVVFISDIGGNLAYNANCPASSRMTRRGAHTLEISHEGQSFVFANLERMTEYSEEVTGVAGKAGIDLLTQLGYNIEATTQNLETDKRDGAYKNAYKMVEPISMKDRTWAMIYTEGCKALAALIDQDFYVMIGGQKVYADVIIDSRTFDDKKMQAPLILGMQGLRGVTEFGNRPIFGPDSEHEDLCIKLNNEGSEDGTASVYSEGGNDVGRAFVAKFRMCVF